jgi:hypothetical protein
MVIDPILRFNWVLYIVDPLQLQHSAKTSFVAALGEIFRRGIWSVFRVENEHCTNVGRFRASRDVPLPYEVAPSPEVQSPAADQRGDRVDEEQPARKRKSAAAPPNGLTPTTSATGADLERSRSSARQRRGFPQAEDEVRPSPLQRAFTHVGDIFRDAHAQDFERKKKPELGRDLRNDKMDDGESTDESDNEENQETSGNVTGGDDGEDGNLDSEKSDDEVQDDVEESAISRIREDLSVGMSGAGEGSSGR